jgi:hypothetical protein
MLKKQGLGLAVLLALTLRITDLFAEEEFVITTYYPSPYGSYNELEVYRSVTYKPINKDAITNPKEGELVYDASKDALYLYNGSQWVAQGAGGTIYTIECSWGCSTGYYCTSTCTPPDCASGFTSLGVGCAASGGGVTMAYEYWGAGIIGNGYGYCKRICYKP